MQFGNARVDEAALTDLCRRHRVREVSVFGSAARGEMRPNRDIDSDIDLLVEFLPDAEVDPHSKSAVATTTVVQEDAQSYAGEVVQYRSLDRIYLNRSGHRRSY